MAKYLFYGTNNEIVHNTLLSLSSSTIRDRHAKKLICSQPVYGLHGTFLPNFVETGKNEKSA